MTILKNITATNLINGNFAAITERVNYSVADLIDCTPIGELRRLLGPDQEHKLEIFLVTQIQALADTLNLGVAGNLQPYQIPTIAKQLIELYPVETLEDFVLCFRKGALSQFGQLYNRLDIAVLSDWMQKYLDEKYQLIETIVTQTKKDNNAANEVNYEKYKERLAAEQERPKVNNAAANAYTRQRLATPYAYYNVRGLDIMATSQSHAEEIVERLLKLGIVEEYEKA